NCKKLLLPLLCVMALLVGMLTPLSAVADKTIPAAEQPTAIDLLLERDGYLEGIWYPWFDWYQIGCNLVDNSNWESYLGSDWWKGQPQYQGGIDRYGVERIYCDLINMKSIGFNIIGFGASMYGEGIIYDDNGDVVGIEEDYLRNVHRFLDICREIGVAIMWNVHFHSEGMSDEYVDGKPAWDIISQMICNPEVTEHFVERFVRPLSKVLAQYPDVVIMASAMDESDNIITDSDLGDHFEGDRVLYGVNEDALVNFIDRVTDTMREEMPGVEMMLAGNSSDFSRYSSVDLDFMGRSIYSEGYGVDRVVDYETVFPVIATEFGMPTVMTEEGYSSLHIQKREEMIRQGYKGWFMWCWQSDVGGGHHDVMLQGMQHFTDFRPMVFNLNHYIQDYRAAHRSETLVLDTPAMFYNAGDTIVSWIGARQATKMDLLRSDDGGKTWKKLLDNVDQSICVDENGKGLYYDTTAPKSGYMYKVVVRDDQGNEKESEPTNKPEDAGNFFASKDYSGNYGGLVNTDPVTKPDQATEPATPGVTPLTLSSFGVLSNRPFGADKNLINNGSFEATDNAQWNVDTFLGTTVSVVTDETTRSGNKSLYFNTSKESKAAWHVFWLDVEPNTDYTFSAWIKGAFISDDNRYCASIGVMDPDSKQFMIRKGVISSTTTRQLFPTAWDNEWHLRSVAFNSGSKTKVGIALYGHSSQMWVDDIALFKSSEGIKYSNPEIAGSIVTKMYLGDDGCTDADNMVRDPRVEDVSYWQSGEGFKNGFVSIQENEYEYGNSLKYTAGDMLGYVYLKWVDLKPNTDYVFSADLKVLENGAGYFALATRTIKGLIFAQKLDLDQSFYGEGWFSYQTMFNSGNYDRIALAFVDLGGSALMDNIRIFEKSKAIESQDEYLDNRNGWIQDDYGWVYYENGEMVTNRWVKDSVGWCYLGADGYCVTNKWVADSVGWCYLDGNGRMVTNKWVKDSVGWCYLGADGYCVTNKWVADSIGWCYLDGSGRMVTNKWVKDSVGWCYLGADGYCVTNKWVADSKGWCYLDGNGRMVTNKWVADSKGWCYIGEAGYCLTNAWVQDSKGWCYLDANGRMVYDTWVDGYYVNANGYWVK
ncbi:MAG: carbohydrate binding domain-containing protein, partial [Clostridia bacterium]|nr:carbohydrate binding domain-containing protein [Clostridia bacterium]